MKKIFTAIIIILLMTFIYTELNSWNSDDASSYVQALLDSSYLDKHDESINIIDMTLDESEAFYRECLQIEADYLSNYFVFNNITDELNERTLSILDSIYSHSKYIVHKAEELSGDRFLVKVEIHPIDVISKTNDALAQFEEEFNQKYADVNTEAMSDIEYEAWLAEYDLDWSMSILDIIESNISTIDYLEPVSYNVEVFLDDEGYYDVSDDYYNIDEVIIQY